ncbi:MAG: ethanolamine ammonia-lyase subunit EutC [Hyphomicrobium sp.]|nr:ethanolamine ammonia-lyase subunit EutC [Hyphomicrobium sp.]
MSNDSDAIVVKNPWGKLRQHTSARIALGRSGTSLPTGPHLEFQLAHARARNAVHHELNTVALSDALRARGFDVITAHSAAESRPVYLQRPDKGRRLDAPSRSALEIRPADTEPADVVFVIGDGLSALAIEENAVAFLDAVMPSLKADHWRVGPVVVVSQARVAVGDEVAEVLGAKIVVVLIGERPGLSSPDSMGIYMTLGPRSGMTDESRNCISNVRVEGLRYDLAAHKLLYLMTEAKKRGLSGVLLKDEAEDLSSNAVTTGQNFLLSAD